MTFILRNPCARRSGCQRKLTTALRLLLRRPVADKQQWALLPVLRDAATAQRWAGIPVPLTEYPVATSRWSSRQGNRLSSIIFPLWQPVTAFWACQCTTLRRALLTQHSIAALPCPLTEQV